MGHVHGLKSKENNYFFADALQNNISNYLNDIDHGISNVNMTGNLNFSI